MKESKEKPLTPGYYWFLHPVIKGPMLVRVFQTGNNYWVYKNLTLGTPATEGTLFLNGSWLGPLPEAKVVTINGERRLARADDEPTG